MQFSLLLPVYYGDQADWLALALESVQKQSRLPDEVILIEDGPLTKKLADTIEKFKKLLPLKIVKIEKNQGLATALNYGLKHAKFDFVARFDADDICLPDRFQKQIDFLSKNPEIDLVGGLCKEFIVGEPSFSRQKEHPQEHKKIVELAKKRNPINHTTVFFRKSAVIKSGCYDNFFSMEDYHLWVKMILNGYQLSNIPETLVLQRVSKEVFQRRGGLNYLKTELKLNSFFLSVDFINIYEFIRNLIIRLILRMSPSFCRKIIYNLIRKKV